MAWTRTYDVTRMHPNLAELRSAMRITGNELDAQLLDALKAAIEGCEKYIGSVIARSTFIYSGSFVQSLCLKTPVISVAGVKIDGVELSSGQYSASNGILSIADGVTGSTMQVRTEAGMEDTPYDIRDAVKMRAIARFQTPGDSIQEHFRASDSLLRPYRKWEVR